MKAVPAGPFPNCHDCGAVMVWDDVRREMPVWMCPRCVLECCRRAEAAVDIVMGRPTIDGWRVAGDVQERLDQLGMKERLP